MSVDLGGLEHSTLQGGKWERGASHRKKAVSEDQRGHSTVQGAAWRTEQA